MRNKICPVPSADFLSFPRATAPSPRSYPPGPTLVTLFEGQVERTPERIALTGVDHQLSYRELNSRADQLADCLRARGVAPEVKVGLFVQRSPELVIAILAILKAGGAYVPIDPSYPPERISFLLTDAELGVLVTQTNLESKLPPHPVRVVRLDEVPETASANLPRVPAQPQSLAYVIYTSGSTGRPKGVEITHHNVVRLFQAAAEWFDFNADDVWSLFHSCAFDFSVWEIWGALLHGGRLVIVPLGVSRSPADFLQLLARERVTVLNQTPSAFRQLQHAEQDAPPEGGLALRYVIFGGEAIDLRSLRPWFERHGDERPRLVNMYGITETTVHVTVRPLARNDTDSGSLIGVPLPDLQLHLLDDEQRPVAVGEVGEIYVGGAGLARGYLNRAELTAQRFINNPFAPEERLYRSGDLARQLPGGELEYLGRCDQQVKIRGFRVELGEIESALGSHVGVRAAVVVARAETSGDKRLVAYVVADLAQRPTLASLREHARAGLPDYMVPAAFVFLERLPLTAHGKIDREALPAPAAERPDLAVPYIAPRTPVERRLAAIWAEVLQLDRVGLDDPFYELGGDSLLLVALVERLREEGFAQVSPTELFQYPTVGALARFVGALPASVHADETAAAQA
jgi:amino acid adenylation domain-containing protein